MEKVLKSTDGPSTTPGHNQRDTTQKNEHGQEKRRNKRQAEHRNEPTDSAKSRKERHKEKTQAADVAADGDAKKGTGNLGANDESGRNDPAGADASTDNVRSTPVASNK